MNPLFHTDFSISDSLKIVRKYVLIYETIIEIPLEDRDSISSFLFLTNNSRLCLINIEFMDMFYETSEDQFTNLVSMYLGKDTEYINLYQNEAYLIIHDTKYMKHDVLEAQLNKFMRDIKQFSSNELSIVVGQPIEDVQSLEVQLKYIRTIRQDIFGFGDSIIWADSNNVVEHYALDVEVIKKQLMQAIESNDVNLMKVLSIKLTKAIISNHVMSKLYIQNMFYTVINGLYDKYPGISQEEIKKSIDILFQMKNANHIIEMFPDIFSKLVDQIKEEEQDNSNIVLQIKRLIEREYKQDISLKYIAEYVHLAPAYVSYVFKKETGQTIVSYITDVRMKKAKALLEQGGMKIIEICHECGYDNPSYFNRLFKNYYGITPKQFKEK